MRNLLSGENIKLTAIKEMDLGIIEEWFNDVEFMRNYDILPAIPQGHNEVKEMVEYFSKSNERYILAIRPRDSDEIIGVTGFLDIMWSNRVATFFIGICSSSYQGRGIGKEAMNLMLDFGFNELNFHRIQLNVIDYNKRAIRLYEVGGFVREGTLRKLILRDGKRYDLHYYGLLREEWVNKKG